MKIGTRYIDVLGDESRTES